jgi:hypothetical protein
MCAESTCQQETDVVIAWRSKAAKHRENCDSGRRTCLNFLWGVLASMYFHRSWRCPGQLPHLPSPIATPFEITVLASLGARASRASFSTWQTTCCLGLDCNVRSPTAARLGGYQVVRTKKAVKGTTALGSAQGALASIAQRTTGLLGHPIMRTGRKAKSMWRRTYWTQV